jgi:hypothetical protein
MFLLVYGFMVPVFSEILGDRCTNGPGPRAEFERNDSEVSPQARRSREVVQISNTLHQLGCYLISV